MKKKVILAGGTGFIGKYLADKFNQLGYEVMIIARTFPHITWDNHAKIVEALEDSELLINLAGKSVNCRYHDKNKEEILKSRTETTHILGNAVLACKNPPPLWINSSTATIYRHAEDRPMTEGSGELGTGFSVDVAKEWESAFFSFDLPHTRQVALRMAIVLGENGGVIEPYKNLVRFGLGGVQGSGNQRFSWIHVEDVYQIILFLKERGDLSGVFNCSSPHPVTNREFMQHFRNVMNRSFGLPSPKWMLEMGAVMIGTETELVLKSRWVIPERLEREGYQFRFAHIDKTLQDILK
ncbi:MULTISPECIES: TIGR01777 family oxidoreductase [Brevibacillus]|uniref:TIGR01777 family protein n=1 Tax=Brevibacillus porteri TaxID=2126350 RepID=A0ABX5FMS3_9BACL|nr:MULTISPECIES: TIGR01777 family oxidoreductase [Brevibacillus]MDC0763692.1 TIGR01777 family oxidoreductase [Brevibacillus sp. AG]MED1799913.1 TIGR01777 family oxidoreductase [Brevibacillus porteri]MED2132937.1 TIGR01777 family oxidoreductase [Brevibacillus porteri]MED2744150.1 TIGR01777 family oxidoreductase [Brevibacillus porteri]MED2816810.1 TIGR01777 family oxidoreductase [Brevibacillus porteri]